MATHAEVMTAIRKAKNAILIAVFAAASAAAGIVLVGIVLWFAAFGLFD